MYHKHTPVQFKHVIISEANSKTNKSEDVINPSDNINLLNTEMDFTSNIKLKTPICAQTINIDNNCGIQTKFSNGIKNKEHLSDS